MVLGSSPVAITSPSDFAPASSKEFLDIQATVECGFTLKRLRDMTRTYGPRYVAFYNPWPTLQSKGMHAIFQKEGKKCLKRGKKEENN